MQAEWKGHIRPPCADRTFADAAAVKDMQFAGAGVEIEADAQNPAKGRGAGAWGATGQRPWRKTAVAEEEALRRV